MRALDAEVVEQVDARRAPTSSIEYGPGGDRRSRRGRACRSGRAGSARRAPRPAGPTSRSVAPSEFESTSAGASSGPVTTWWGIIGGSSARSTRRRRRRCRRRRRGSRACARRRPRGLRARCAARRAAEPVGDQQLASAGATRLCQAPAARSCSCTIAASSVATSPGACLRAAERGDRGDRVVLVRHRRRAAAAGLAHLARPRSGASSVTSRAALPTAPAATPSAPASSPIAAAQRVPGQHAARRGRGRGERCDGSRGRSVPDRPAELARRARERGAGASAASSSPTIQPAAFSPNVVGCACWSSVRPMIGVSRCVCGELRRGVGGAAQVVRAAARARAWSRASPRCRRRPGSSRRGAPGASVAAFSALHHRARRVADLGRAGADLGRRRSGRRRTAAAIALGLLVR